MKTLYKGDDKILVCPRCKSVVIAEMSSKDMHYCDWGTYCFCPECGEPIFILPNEVCINISYRSKE